VTLARGGTGTGIGVGSRAWAAWADSVMKKRIVSDGDIAERLMKRLDGTKETYSWSMILTLAFKVIFGKYICWSSTDVASQLVINSCKKECEM